MDIMKVSQLTEVRIEPGTSDYESNASTIQHGNTDNAVTVTVYLTADVC